MASRPRTRRATAAAAAAADEASLPNAGPATTVIPAPALTSADEAIHFLEDNLDLDSLAVNLCNDPYAMPADLIDLAIHEYRRFLVLKVAHNDGQAVLLSPSAIIDAVWHAHILDTRAYLAMNQRLPFWIHHEPKGAWVADSMNRTSIPPAHVQ
ncbi:hypothetical protein GGF31_007318 [Allomyces arbusculus]|nr:hypothetical protein GGF31_007318 [Allomyces arbusculus]